MTNKLLKEIESVIQNAKLLISSTKKSGENGLRNADEIAKSVLAVIMPELESRDKALERATRGLDLIELENNAPNRKPAKELHKTINLKIKATKSDIAAILKGEK